MKFYLLAFYSFLSSSNASSERNLRGESFRSDDVTADFHIKNRLLDDLMVPQKSSISDGLDNEYDMPEGTDESGNADIDEYDPIAMLEDADWPANVNFEIDDQGTGNLAPDDELLQVLPQEVPYMDGDADIAEEDDVSAGDLAAIDSESSLFNELILNQNDGEENDHVGEGRNLQRSLMSRNLYAIPYEAGTRVRVNRDHITHTPPNRIDMSGKDGGGQYNIVAALDGTIMFIEDSYNVNGGCENNNYVWIAHTNGEWTKYSHLAYQSASVNAGLSVGDYVNVAQFIGVEDDIGCASGDHLHWEVAVPNDLSDPINPIGGYIKGVNLIPRICGIPNNQYSAGTTYSVPGVRPGWNEYARHGLADSAFQADFNAAARCGYRMDWNSGYDTGGGSPSYNVVYHSNKSPSLSWKSHRRLTQAQLTSKKTQYGSQGYKLIHIDVYNLGTSVRYAAIFHKGTGVPSSVATYHGVSAAQHQTYFDVWKQYSYKPRVISVASVNGNRYYAGVYTTDYIGSWFAKSQQTSSQYQTNFNAQKAAGRRLLYLKNYVHNNQRYYSAIWASQTKQNVSAKHGLTSSSYQNHFDLLVGAGYETRCVSATKVNGSTRWAAFWDKD